MKTGGRVASGACNSGDCGSLPFLKPYETTFGFVISRIFNETYSFIWLSDVSYNINGKCFLLISSNNSFVLLIILIIVL